MRFINLMTKKDFDYAMRTIDEDVQSGAITREEAHKSIQKIKKAYSTNKVNKDIAKAVGKRNNYKILG